MSDILTFFTSLGAGGLASAIVVWFGRSWISERLKNAIKHEYDAKLETHKAQLSAENSATLEKLKTQLQAASLERQIQFSSVYAKREELLGKLHNSMTDLLEACQEATRPGSPQIPAVAQEKFQAMHRALDEAAIYFPESVSERWHQHTLDLQLTLSAFLSAREIRTSNFHSDLERSKTSYDTHLAAYKTMRSELRQEIRRWLGTA